MLSDENAQLRRALAEPTTDTTPPMKLSQKMGKKNYIHLLLFNKNE